MSPARMRLPFQTSRPRKITKIEPPETVPEVRRSARTRDLCCCRCRFQKRDLRFKRYGTNTETARCGLEVVIFLCPLRFSDFYASHGF
jgi:hypothetical protein